MSETIIGVIIGGFLTGIGTWFAMWLQHRKWKIEQKIRLIENKRDRFRDLASETLKDIQSGISNNSYSSDMLANIAIIFPPNVRDEFNKFMDKENKSETDLKHGYFKIALEIKTAISDFDKKIEELL